ELRSYTITGEYKQIKHKKMIGTKVVFVEGSEAHKEINRINLGTNYPTYTGTVVADAQDGDWTVAIDQNVATYDWCRFGKYTSDRPNLIVLSQEDIDSSKV